MSPKKRDYSVLDKFNFERKPVGVRFTIDRPRGIPRLTKEMNMCEMLKEAQQDGAFYAGDKWYCVGVEEMILGIKDPEPVLVSGIFGGEEGLFRDATACRTMYQYLPTLPKGSVRYVTFAPLDKLTFDPDLLVITANVAQAQTVLRSINYSTGAPFVSRATPVVACAWIYVYPVVSGELNYYVTGLGLGMQALDVFPPGLFLISVPFQIIPTMLENLAEMPVHATSEAAVGGPAHRKRVNKFKEDLIKKIEE